MSRHEIKLRAGWEILDPAPSTGAPRIALPVITWPVDLPPKIKLLRSFGKPAIEADTTRLFLAIHQVPGLTQISLNDQELALIQRSNEMELPIQLERRNRLVFEVDLDVARARAPENGWGWVSIVIVEPGELPDTATLS